MENNKLVKTTDQLILLNNEEKNLKNDFINLYNEHLIWVVYDLFTDKSKKPILSGMTEVDLGKVITDGNLKKHNMSKEIYDQLKGITVEEAITATCDVAKLTGVGAAKFLLTIAGICVIAGVGVPIYITGKLAKFSTLGLANVIPGISREVNRDESKSPQRELGITSKTSKFAISLKKYTRGLIKLHSHGRVNRLEVLGYHAILNTNKFMTKINNEKWLTPTATNKVRETNKDRLLKKYPQI